MNDEKLESVLRDLPGGVPPKAWRASILATARREAVRSRETRPGVLLYLRALFVRNPVTAGGLTAVWLLILLLKTGTPSEPVADRLLARAKMGAPGMTVPWSEESHLVALLQDEADPEPMQRP